MAWPNFSVTTAYATLISGINTAFQTVGKLFKDQTTGDYVDQIRYNSSTKKLEFWNGSAWATLDLTGTAVTNATNATNATNIADGAVSTAAKIANNIITLAKMSRTGTSGQVLTSGGTGADPSYQNTVTSVNGQTGAVVFVGSGYPVGSIIIGRPNNYELYYESDTVSGSVLRSATLLHTYSGGEFTPPNKPIGGLVSVGTWRCISGAWGDGTTIGYMGLWQRVS